MASKNSENTMENEVLAEIPDHIQKELSPRISQLQGLWQENNKPRFHVLVNDIVNKSSNPYWAALYLFIKSIYKTAKGKNANKELIDLAVMENLKKWLESMKFDYKLHCQFRKTRALLTDKIRVAAFKIVHAKSCSVHFKIVSEVYGFADSLNSFLPFIFQLIRNRNFAVACNCVIELEMQRFFTSQDIILHLFFDGKPDHVHRYLVDKEERKYFVKVLDDICCKKQSLNKMDFFEDGVLIARINEMEISKLVKSVAKLAKTLNVPREYYPYVSDLNMVTIMRFIIHKFDENDSANEDLEDFIMEVAGDSFVLQSEAINLLEKSHFLAQAVSLAKKWSASPSNLHNRFNLPNSVRASLDSVKVYSPVTAKPNQSLYYVPKMIGEIKWVSNTLEFEKCVQNLRQNARVVGMDVEWRPNFFGKAEKPSLIQLAYQKGVYILDVLQLQKELNAYHWHGLVEKIFANPSIVKLGFSSQDWDVIAYVHDAFQDVGKVTKNFKDMRTLCKQILNDSPNAYKYVKDMNPINLRKESLNIFVELCFGKPLDKGEQFSNWERRPLRESQLRYAAYDAFALIDIHRELKMRCPERNI